MSFAQRYIDRNISHDILIQDKPADDLGIIVIIPACNEPDMLKTINSLAGCELPTCSVEVIVVVNESEQSSELILEQNERSIKEIENWVSHHARAGLKFQVIHSKPFPKKHAGAGLARKTGMDEAIYRFHLLDKPDGILVSLDADTFVDPDYLTAIDCFFTENPKCAGATIRFSHRVDEIEDERQKAGIILYEKYLHYYKRALAYTGFPHAIYTVGSAFATKAEAYVKQGGMSKRQAGEDFYFLHKLTQIGEVGEINSTCVYPSARISDRVPFGTGPVLKKWVDGDESLRLTYNLQAFRDLKRLFQFLPKLYDQDFDFLNEDILGNALISFLKEDKFDESLKEIRENCSSFAAFEKRFFFNFNAFKILKFLNYSHPLFYPYQDIHEGDDELAEAEN